jgi:hypothetical protein
METRSDDIAVRSGVRRHDHSDYIRLHSIQLPMITSIIPPLLPTDEKERKRRLQIHSIRSIPTNKSEIVTVRKCPIMPRGASVRCTRILHNRCWARQQPSKERVERNLVNFVSGRFVHEEANEVRS